MIDSTSHNTDYLLRKDIKENLVSQEKWDIFYPKIVINKRKITDETWNNIVVIDANKNKIELKITRDENHTVIFKDELQKENAS